MEQTTSYDLLNKIDSPEDLRKLSVEALPEVCNQLRNKIIDELSRNPGHFGSSLGVIELTVALALCVPDSLRPYRLGCRTSGIRT